MNTQVTLTLSEPVYQQVQTIAQQSDRTIADLLTEIITLSLNQKTTGESILEMIANFTADLTTSEKDQLPTDAAENHDFYIYKNS
ncbi:MAG: hypothetical protein QQW96_14375 [Tychonema bourrellyi B0820]|nr:hypothetical protein [Tychonema bourrellyi]MDQ2098823.1 hypothetical protein [Tychonema bourrellyi B0820]